MVAVTVLGATGRVGRHVVTALRSQMAKIKIKGEIRCGTRQPDKLKVDGGFPVLVDWDDVATLTKAVEGADAVFVVTPENRMEWCATDCEALARVISQSSVKHVVKLSCVAAATSPTNGPAAATNDPRNNTANLIGKWHGSGEERLKTSGVAVTCVRSSMLYSTILRCGFEGIRNKDRYFSPMGWGPVRVNYVHDRDVGDVAAQVLMQHVQPHSFSAVSVCGPDTVTGEELAQIITWGCKRKIEFRGLDPKAVPQHLQDTLGVSGETLRGLENMWSVARSGGFDVQSNNIHEITGAYPRDLAAFFEDHAQELGDTF